MRPALFDASVFVQAYVGDADSEHDVPNEALRCLTNYHVVTLDFAHLEVANAMRTHQRHGIITKETAQAVLASVRHDYDTLPAHSALENALSLGINYLHSIYDCLYVETARRHDLVLVTADARMARKFETVLSKPIVNLHDLPGTLP